MRNESLVQLADNLVKKTEELFLNANTEEDLRIGFEKILEPIADGKTSEVVLIEDENEHLVTKLFSKQ